MASVSWDSEEVIHVDILQPHAKINAQYYSNLLLNNVHTAICKKGSKKLSEGQHTPTYSKFDEAGILGLGNLESLSLQSRFSPC
jgi:hypothetical protein